MDEGWTTQIDAYCERVDPSFWAEPVNALTNLSFLLAAAFAYREVRRDGTLEPGVGLLLGLMLAIGIGSFLFHTLATRWAALADTLPITLFILCYLTLTLRRGFGLGWLWAVALGLGFLPLSGLVAAGAAAVTGGLLGGSSGYLPALAALVVCGALLRTRNTEAGRGLLVAAGLFLVSLTFRTLDQPLCPLVPLGTHFLWHLLNGVLLGYLVLLMARMSRMHDGPPAARPA
jgi:hypothetical protein